MRSYPPEVYQAIVVSQNKFVWETPLFEKRDRGPRWYLLMSLAALFLVAYSVWSGNFIFAFLILLASIIILLAGNEEPRQALVQIGDLGVVWNGKYHPFEDFVNFAIIYQPPVAKVLYLEHRSAFVPRFRIDLDEQDPVAIREHLQQFVKEETALQSEHLSDILGRLLKI
jgi:hypothetical protein